MLVEWARMPHEEALVPGEPGHERLLNGEGQEPPPPVSFSRSACSASSEAREPPSLLPPVLLLLLLEPALDDPAPEPLEYDVASPASTSAWAASACCLTCAS